LVLALVVQLYRRELTAALASPPDRSKACQISSVEHAPKSSIHLISSPCLDHGAHRPTGQRGFEVDRVATGTALETPPSAPVIVADENASGGTLRSMRTDGAVEPTTPTSDTRMPGKNIVNIAQTI
jgi:hypothetical protein